MAQLHKSDKAGLSCRPEPIIQLACPACAGTTAHQKLYSKNSCDILRCAQCGLGRAECGSFDVHSYYTEDYFSGAHGDGYADYRGSEPVLRREFARTVRFIRRFRENGRLLDDVAGIEIADAAVAFLQRTKRRRQKAGSRQPQLSAGEPVGLLVSSSFKTRSSTRTAAALGSGCESGTRKRARPSATGLAALLNVLPGLTRVAHPLLQNEPNLQTADKVPRKHDIMLFSWAEQRRPRDAGTRAASEKAE